MTTRRHPRVCLRLICKQDQEPYFAVRRASEDFLAPWEPTPRPGIDYYSGEFFDELLEGFQHARRDVLIVERLKDDQILGVVSLTDIARGAFHNAHLGYWIGAPFARQGYMKEAVALILERAFSFHELHRIEANIMPSNTASLALIRSAGFRYEGLSKRYLKICGQWEDHERWAMTAEEWSED